MTYTSRTYYGDVIRQSDGKVVAPVSDTSDPDYLAWVAWCEAGNEPAVDDSMLPQEEPIPPSLSPWQARKALNAWQMRDAVEAMVAQQPQDVRDGWEFATEFLFDDPLLNAMAPALGIDLAEFFRFASTL